MTAISSFIQPVHSEECNFKTYLLFPARLPCLRSFMLKSCRMMIEIRTQGGSVSYDVPVIKAKELSVEEIFDKGFFA